MIRLHRNGNSHNGNGHVASVDPEVMIRALSAGDANALKILAERDSARVPDGSVLVAERDGHLLAAISTSDGRIVADPFHPTTDLVSLLRLRAGQLVPPLN